MTDDGGQVFPTMKKMGELEVSEGGMTVRQLYAGMVGARLAAQYTHNVPGVAERVAEDSFSVADAMIQVFRIHIEVIADVLAEQECLASGVAVVSARVAAARRDV